jgi:hypothetical protein
MRKIHIIGDWYHIPERPNILAGGRVLPTTMSEVSGSISIENNNPRIVEQRKHQWSLMVRRLKRRYRRRENDQP